ncbi:MAG: hypothetical protein EXQ98_06320 [Alphaproteobacteria bacterium]|nr:hypothetical protein [Alphaproteobacteria bacterium]
MDYGIGLAINLFLELLSTAPTSGMHDADPALCESPPAYEQSARPGEMAPALMAECGDEAHDEAKSDAKP